MKSHEQLRHAGLSVVSGASSWAGVPESQDKVGLSDPFEHLPETWHLSSKSRPEASFDTPRGLKPPRWLPLQTKRLALVLMLGHVLGGVS